LAVYFTLMSAEPATHYRRLFRNRIEERGRALTEVGGWPPTVSMRNTLVAREPETLFSISQSTLVAELVGAVMSPALAASTNAFALPAFLPVEVKSHSGESPVPEGEGTK
jgi:hypothetical protein